MKNYAILTLSIDVPDRTFMDAPVLNLELKSAEEEIGEIQSTIPLTILNFYDPLDFSVEECRDAFKNSANQELCVRLYHADMATTLGKLTLSIDNFKSAFSQIAIDFRDPSVGWLAFQSENGHGYLVRLGLLNDQELELAVRSHLLDQFASSLFDTLSFLFAN